MTPRANSGSRQTIDRAATRLIGLIIIGLALLLGWKKHWFHAESDLSQYPVIQLAYTTCTFERTTHAKSSVTRQIALLTPTGRYDMEEESGAVILTVPHSLLPFPAED